MTIRSSFPAALALLVMSGPAFGQAVSCPQFFPGGQPPALVNSSLAQRTTLLCNDAYAVLASGVTHGAMWSAEHPTTASLDAARGIERQGVNAGRAAASAPTWAGKIQPHTERRSTSRLRHARLGSLTV